MRRSEFDWSEVPYPDRLEGHAEPARDNDDHSPHAFLYVPDLSSMTGWAGHAVPMERQKRRERPPMGFRR